MIQTCSRGDAARSSTTLCLKFPPEGSVKRMEIELNWTDLDSIIYSEGLPQFFAKGFESESSLEPQH